MHWKLVYEEINVNIRRQKRKAKIFPQYEYDFTILCSSISQLSPVLLIFSFSLLSNILLAYLY